jgi:phage terminase large subunit-like protein
MMTGLSPLRQGDAKAPASRSFVPISRAAWLALTRTQKQEFLAGLTPQMTELMAHEWQYTARPHQWPPACNRNGTDWTTWLLLGGRGAGKTRAGAEWVRGLALGLEGFSSKPVGRIALVGESAADVRDVMIEGVSGLMCVHRREERPLWQSSRRRLEWPNGAVAQAFSAEDPESLRGPQFDAAWCDEIGKWKQARATWDMLQFGLRLGAWPCQMVTTTPRPTALVKQLMADPNVALTRMRTKDNAVNLAGAFLESVVGTYAGTALGRQELDGELVEERQGALWTRAGLEACREREAPALVRIVIAVDPPASSGKRADACGLVAAGIDSGGVVHVLEDATLSQAMPHEWAGQAAALYHAWAADALVVEVNQGGEMATAVIREVDSSVPVTPVRATRGKYLRAEPVAALYAQGRVRHAGTFPQLEDEMCDFAPGGLSTGRSPDRLDALVWAVTHLALGVRGRPRVRGL